MDAGLARRVRNRLEELRTVIADRELFGGGVVHGDAHLANVLWHEGHLGCPARPRMGANRPRDLELEAACRDDPDIEAQARHGSCAASDVPVLSWLRAGYPGLFEHENLTERLWLYELSYQVRQLCVPDVITADALRLERLAILADRPRVRFA